jgi:hypothetical protein
MNRAGRVGAFSKKGTIINFVTRNDKKTVKEIEGSYGIQVCVSSQITCHTGSVPSALRFCSRSCVD